MHVCVCVCACVYLLDISVAGRIRHKVNFWGQCVWIQSFSFATQVALSRNQSDLLFTHSWCWGGEEEEMSSCLPKGIRLEFGSPNQFSFAIAITLSTLPSTFACACACECMCVCLAFSLFWTWFTVNSSDDTPFFPPPA